MKIQKFELQLFYQNEKFMKQMKKLKLTGISFLFMFAGILVSCSSGSDNSEDNTSGEGNKQEMESQEKGSKNQQDARKQLEQAQQVDTNISDEQLEKFAKASKKLNEAMSPREAMQDAIEESGLSQEEYRSIAQQQKGGMQGQEGQEGGSDVSDEKMEKFQDARQKMQKIQQKNQQKMKEILDEMGMTQQELQNTQRAIQQSKSLQEKFRKIRSQQQKENMGNGQ